jgi:outer membrane immunogenic protein
MRKHIALFVTLCVIGWPAAAWAVLKESTVTVTDNGKPIPGATIKLTSTQTPAPKAAKKTNQNGKVTLRYDDRKINRGAVVHVTVQTQKGRVLERDVSIDLLIAGGTIELGGVGATPFDVPPESFPGPNWQGPYLGGGVGGQRSQCPDFNNQSTTIIQQTQSPQGPVSTSFTIPQGNDNQACGSSGARASVVFGTNWQVAPRWVVGVEGDVGFSNSQGQIRAIPGTSGIIAPAAVASNDSVTMKENWDAGLRARLGFAVTPSVLVFGTGGLAWQNVQVNMNCTTMGICGAIGIPAFSANASTTMSGWSVGGGIDVKLSERWSARGEYRYANFGSWQTAFTSPAGPVGLSVTADITMRTQMMLFALIYAFGGSAGGR